jgi:hypothetical protein
MPTKTTNTYPNRVQLEALAGHPSASVGVTAASGHIIKQGDVVGRITSSSKYRRRSRTNATGTGFANNSPTGQVEDSSVFKPGDVLTTSTGTAIGTVLSVNPAANPDTVTLTGNAANNVAAGVAVIATDGSAVAQGVSDNETDGSQDVSIAVIISSKLNESLLRGLDNSAKTELAGASVAGGVFKF